VADRGTGVFGAGDDTLVEIYEKFLRNVDEERRRVGRPPAFGGAS
jgi:hypothetical protein